MPKIEQGVHVQSYSSMMPQSSSHPTTPTPPTTSTYIPRSLPRGIGFIDFPGSDPPPPVRSDLVWRSVDSYLPSANAVLCDAPVGARIPVPETCPTASQHTRALYGTGTRIPGIHPSVPIVPGYCTLPRAPATYAPPGAFVLPAFPGSQPTRTTPVLPETCTGTVPRPPLQHALHTTSTILPVIGTRPRVFTTGVPPTMPYISSALPVHLHAMLPTVPTTAHSMPGIYNIIT